MCSPTEPDFSGFIFKIQANMNPAHRDRLAFMRIVLRRVREGHGRSGTPGRTRPSQLKQPQQFMADEREAVEKGLGGRHHRSVRPRHLRLGDTLSGGPEAALRRASRSLRRNSSPACAPADTMKRKQFQKGITQLAEEGAIQTFMPHRDGARGIHGRRRWRAAV